MSLLLSARITCYNLIIFGWDSYIKNIIYRYVLCASVELLNASKFFFKAFTLLSRLSITFQTCPYAPDPIFFNTSNLLKICVYKWSVILLEWKFMFFAVFKLL